MTITVLTSGSVLSVRCSAPNRNFRHQRQTSIDEELFEVVAGYEALIEKANKS